MPLLVLLLAITTVWYLMTNRPEVKHHERKKQTPVVEVQALQPTDYRIAVTSQGTVAPRTQTTLVAEVRGKVTHVADNFRVGGVFSKGDELVTIDDRDYQHARIIAAAELAKARVALNQEKARSEQARIDWERLGKGKPPSDLVLRKPQLASARAAVAAAEARLAQTRTDLERTRITAPYTGRVREKKADLGQFVTPGTALGTIYAIDYVEINLPLTAEQLAMIGLPTAADTDAEWPSVSLKGEDGRWSGRLVRTTGTIDPQTRQQFVVAQVDDPYARAHPGEPQLKIGQFVSARIQGRKLSNVYVIPRAAVKEDDHIVIVTDDNRLQRLQVTPVWRNRNEVVVAEGLSPGMRLVTSPVSYLAEGTEVKARSVDSAEDKSTETRTSGISTRKSSELVSDPVN